MTAGMYRLHGLRVQSDVPLHERTCPSPEQPDVSFTIDRWGSLEDDLEHPVVAELRGAGDRLLYRVFQLPSGAYLLRAFGVADFQISADFEVVRCQPSPSTHLDWIPILLRGTVMALLLDLRGSPTLHASAVEIDGRIVAFAGSSGSGKTTTAAMLCAAGARLVTDDVLTVHLGQEGPYCPAGSTELRLRNPAAGLLDREAWPLGSRNLIDGRLAVRPFPVKEETMPLQAVVFPMPSRSADSPVVHRLRPSDAVFRLAGAPRISGWTCPRILGRAFLHQTGLAAAVPVFEAAVPWGPPWRPDAVRGLFDAVADVAA